MTGNAMRDRLRRAFSAYTKHWVLWSMVALLILGGLIWCTGITWSHLGVLAQFLVGVIALGGYVFSYSLYREQEKHKYMAAVVATFSMPLLADVSGQQQEGKDGKRVLSWIPGFVRKTDGSDEVLEADFCLVNVSESPVTDVRMNCYWHDCEQLDEQPENPRAFFEDDIPMVDGIAKGAEAHFTRTLRLHLINVMDQLAGVDTGRASDFSPLFSWPIPSETRDKPARWFRWTLVLKYKNLQGEPFFSAYKLEGPVKHAETLLLDKYFRMVFLGSFSGDYLTDDGCHQFVANRGFPDAKMAPDWDGVRATIEEAVRRVANVRSGIETEAQGKSSG